MTGSGRPLQGVLEADRTWVEAPTRGSAEIQPPTGGQHTLAGAPTAGHRVGSPSRWGVGGWAGSGQTHEDLAAAWPPTRTQRSQPQTAVVPAPSPHVPPATRQTPTSSGEPGRPLEAHGPPTANYRSQCVNHFSLTTSSGRQNCGCIWRMRVFADVE